MKMLRRGSTSRPGTSRAVLDIGTGIPTAENTHLVAQAANPQCRVVYVDNDPIVLAHARALLSGVTAPTPSIDADLRDTGKILQGAGELLDFKRPVGLLLIAVLHCIPDDEDPRGLVYTLMNALAPGSFLAVTHPGIDQLPEQMKAAEQALTKSMGHRVTFRTHEGVTSFFADLDLLDPGVVAVQNWHPETAPDPVRHHRNVGHPGPQASVNIAEVSE